MNRFRSGDWPLIFICILAAPVLLVAVFIVVATSRFAAAIFGHDPAASLGERYRAKYAILAFTGRCTVGLLLLGLSLWRAI